MNELDDADTKEVFEKMNKQEELMSRLSLAIPEILVIDQWKTYILFLKKCQALLDTSLEDVKKQNITQELLISSEKEARFHLFNFFSCAYCIRQTMFEGKNFTKGQKELETAVTQWKKEPIPRIVIAIRNKYQHGSLMEHVLHYTVRTKHDPNGEGLSVLLLHIRETEKGPSWLTNFSKTNQGNRDVRIKFKESQQGAC